MLVASRPELETPDWCVSTQAPLQGAGAGGQVTGWGHCGEGRQRPAQVHMVPATLVCSMQGSGPCREGSQLLAQVHVECLALRFWGLARRAASRRRRVSACP